MIIRIYPTKIRCLYLLKSNINEFMLCTLFVRQLPIKRYIVSDFYVLHNNHHRYYHLNKSDANKSIFKLYIFTALCVPSIVNKNTLCIDIIQSDLDA